MTGSGPCHLIIIYREVSPGTCKKPERHTLSRGRPGPIASTLAVIPKEFYFSVLHIEICYHFIVSQISFQPSFQLSFVLYPLGLIIKYSSSHN